MPHQSSYFKFVYHLLFYCFMCILWVSIYPCVFCKVRNHVSPGIHTGLETEVCPDWAALHLTNGVTTSNVQGPSSLMRRGEGRNTKIYRIPMFG